MTLFVSQWGEQSVTQFVEQYLNLPDLPYDEVIIVKIITINYTHRKNEHSGKITYGDLRQQASKNDALLKVYPSSDNKEIQNTKIFADGVQVSPVIVVVSNGGKQIMYKVAPQLWTYLTDISYGIYLKQNKTHRRILPKRVKIDLDNRWLLLLDNLVGDKIMKSLAIE